MEFLTVLLKRLVSFNLIWICLVLVSSASAGMSAVSEQVELLLRIDTFDKWINAANINLPFETYHPQGIVKIGDTFFLTAIEGNLAGHLIQFELKSPSTGLRGNADDISRKTATLIRQVQLADPAFKTRIHPGGIDYDSSTNRIWCPLAEKSP